MATGEGDNGDDSSGWDFGSLFNGLGNTITSGFQNALNTISSGYNTIFGWLGNILNAITNGFTAVTTALSDGLQFLFIPGDDWAVDNSPFARMQTTFNNKLQFIQGFQNAFSVLSNVQGHSLDFHVDIYGYRFVIDFSWYENYRLNVRSGLSSLFIVCAVLAVLRNILGAFGVYLTKPGQAQFDAIKDEHIKKKAV